QKQQMISRITLRPRRRRPLPPIPRRHVSLHPQDRLDALLLALIKELDHAEHAPMIGDGQTVHPQRLHPLNQIRNLAGSIEQGIVGVTMQMNEGAWHDPFIARNPPEASPRPPPPRQAPTASQPQALRRMMTTGNVALVALYEGATCATFSCKSLYM